MPLNSQTLANYVNPIFVETGTYHGEAVDLAVKLGFSEIYSTDVNRDFVVAVQQRHLANKTVHLHVGDSADYLEKILGRITKPATFWLDAHPLVTPMPLFDPAFPLLRELLVLRRFLPAGKHVILMDDMRTFGAYELGVLDFCMNQLWPAARHSKLNSHLASGDIYCCEL